MELFNEYKNNKMNEGEKEREATMAAVLKKLLGEDTLIVGDTKGDNQYIVTSDTPELKMLKDVLKKRSDRATKAGVQESESIDAPLFGEHVDRRNSGISYLTEEENAQLDDMMVVFETEYGGDINKLDEGFFGKLVGGAAGFLAGPMIGRIIAKALGIEKGVLYDMFTSRLVSTALGAAIGKAMTGGNK